MGPTHAIVIGGSFSGLTTGRVLSEFFDKVTVFDRDSFPNGVQDRAGVPQARHVHGLLTRGLQEYERLFPGLERMALERGATFHDHTWDFVVLRPQGWQARYRSGLPFLSASRELIESCVRELFRLNPKVELYERTTVTGLRVSRDGPRCTGVIVPSGGGKKVIEADLIVDASGAVSRAPAWLQAAGLTPPEETVVDPLAGYSSRWFQGPPRDQWPPQWWWWAGAYIRRRPDDVIEANFQLKEHDRWHLTLSGFNRRYPPTHEDEFMAMLPRLRSPVIAEMVRMMEPISPVYANRAIRNRWRRYERWRERLDGFIAIGDAYCAYNPVYAQGMTAAVISALALRECLKKYGPADARLPLEFFAAQARVQRDPWLFSAGVDLRFPFTIGQHPLSLRLFNFYLDSVGGAIRDPMVRQRLGEVAQLVRPLSDLFEPSIVGKASLAALKRAMSEVTAAVRPPDAVAISPMPPLAMSEAPDTPSAA